MTYLSSDYVTDTHQVVIHDICKVICWEPVIFENDLIVDHAVIEHDLAMHDVPKFGLSFRDSHSDDVGLSVGLLLFDLLLAVASLAEPVILGFRIFLSSIPDTHLLQSLSRTEARVSITVFE